MTRNGAARLRATVGNAAHVAAYLTILVVGLVLMTLAVGKVGFAIAWLCAPAAAAIAAAQTNRLVADGIALYAVVGVVANAATVVGLRAIGWPLFGVDSVELTTLLAGPCAVFIATCPIGLFRSGAQASGAGR
jgi:hypothetical protein